ncbi:MAG: hypothetical protein COA66_03775 [Arcobacter sp.]|nr:MAG: hypothetical protein COA66_03775 [Arcobacter sp.]
MHISFLSLFLILFFTACSSKINIRSIEPSAIKSHKIKNIHIKSFKNDSINLEEEIKDQMFKLSFEGKKYFNLINNERHADILKEQVLQDSGIIQLKKENPVFTFQEAQSILWGKILKKEIDENTYYKEKTNYNKCVQYLKNKKGERYCSQYYEYEISCLEKKYLLLVQIEIAEVINAQTLYLGNFSATHSTTKCSNNPYGQASNRKVFSKLKKQVVSDFMKIIAPSYSYKDFILLDSPYIKYSSKEEDLLEEALSLIKNKQIKEANILLNELVLSTKSKSYIALYNLALSYEALNELERSLAYYLKAKELMFNEDNKEELSSSLKRIKESIKNKTLANKQLKY